MKRINSLILSVALLAGAGAQADEVISQTRDNSLGAVFGGLGGVLIGGVVGGPLGALVVGGLGLLAGDQVQDASGLSQRAYRVKDDRGEERTVRAPHLQLQPGDRVQLQAGRLESRH